jgi:soluble lytic murein transglycosylase-like protein
MADYIAGSILAAAQTHSLDPRFLAAIVKVESSFDPYCLSSSGAMGLGQLMPFNLRPLGVGNAWDPSQNLQGAARLLRQNLNTYARQPNGTLLAVAAYHAGVGAVNRAGKQVPPRAATQKYVWKVYYAYRALAPELFN